MRFHIGTILLSEIPRATLWPEREIEQTAMAVPVLTPFV
jgi:hypothetical protein